MDDQRLGATIRLLRRRRGWRQVDLGRMAGMSKTPISRLERGHLDGLTIGALRRIAAAVDLRVDQVPRWRGGEVDRMLNRRHSLLHETFARHIGSFSGWIFRPEVSYSIYGERGVIDMLAWHEARAMVLVVEFKTELVDVNDLVGSMDRRRRLAIRIGQDLGWRPVAASSLVVLVGSRTNRRRAAEHRTVLRAAFPFDGRHLSAWLHDPREAVAMLAMWPDVPVGTSGQVREGSEAPDRASSRARSADPRTSQARPERGSGTFRTRVAS
jgi:transcriptional regulator with XRE-family HTH domain